jgi:hypothetical protein
MNNILSWIRHRQLQTPTVILLESYRPMSFMIGQMLVAVEPLLPGIKTSQWGRTLGSWDSSDTAQMDTMIAELVSEDAEQVS